METQVKEKEVFSQYRIDKIHEMKEFLKNTKPEKDPVGKHKIQKVFLLDFLIYAMLRKADYRKADHTGGVKANEFLTNYLYGLEHGYNRGMVKIFENQEISFLIDLIKTEMKRFNT